MTLALEIAGDVGTKAACDALGVSRATLYRRLKPSTTRRQRSGRALSQAERDRVLGVLCGERFCDASPAEVHATLLDEGVHLASVSTMYRILRRPPSASSVCRSRCAATTASRSRPPARAGCPGWPCGGSSSASSSRIQPGHPEENGRLERLHRTLEEAIGRGPRSLADQRRRFDHFRGEYNLERPHEALGQETPSSVYGTSWRPYPPVVQSPEYPDDVHVRSVNEKGRAQWRAHFVRVGRVLRGERVYFEDVGEDRWNVRFGPVYLLAPRPRELTTSLSVADV